MTTLRPNKLDAHLRYTCPKCNTHRWLSQVEAETPGYKFVCTECRSVYQLEPVIVKVTKSSATIKPVYEEKKVQPAKPIPAPPIYQHTALDTGIQFIDNTFTAVAEPPKATVKDKVVHTSPTVFSSLQKVKNVLVPHGYKAREIEGAIKNIPGADKLSVEDLIKQVILTLG